jgi:DNA-binding NarL/FixJ family response regulator
MGQSQKNIRVLLVEDHNVLREGLRALLQQQPDMEVVLGVADGRTAVEETRRLAPDVVVMDIGLPDLNGIDATRQITSDIVDLHLRNDAPKSRSDAYAELTEREREVIQLVSEGLHTKEIADRLHISPKTVLAHRERVMRKLGVDSIAALTRYALREGLSEL